MEGCVTQFLSQLNLSSNICHPQRGQNHNFGHHGNHHGHHGHDGHHHVIMIIITITNNIIKFLIFLPHVLKQDQNVISIPSYFLCGPSPSLGPLHHHHPIIIITTITIIIIIITTITIVIIIIITIISPSLVPLHHHPTYERRQSGNKFQKQKLKPQRLPFHLIRSTHHTLVSCPTI